MFMELFTFLTFLIVICLIKKRLFESEKNPSNEKRISDDINITENPGIVNVVEDKTVETVTQKKVEKKAKDKPIIKLDLTKDPILQKTVRLIEEGKNIFITGGAGTGKSYMLQQLKIYFGIDLQLTSTTGISAININGSTIHSWAGLGIEHNKKNIWNTLNRINSNPVLKQQILNCKILAIDEISMLHSETLEYLDLVLQKMRGSKSPMGGMQVIFIGDFFQLPPVVKERDIVKKDFCFTSQTWRNLNLEIILLKDVKRQSEIRYINVLNHIREGYATEADWDIILERYRAMPADIMTDDSKLHLYATNKDADTFNDMCFDRIPTIAEYFYSDDKIEYYDENERLIFTQKDRNKFKEYAESFEADFRVLHELKLKEECRVMLLKNIAIEEGLANGSCGTVKEIKENVIIVEFDNGKKVPLSKMDFESYKFKEIYIDECMEKSYKQKLVRKQFPVRLAYGITIHKSQGMTFDDLVVHLDKIFAQGQCYVALSRTTSLNGLNPIGFNPNKISVNQDVVNFYQSLEKNKIFHNQNNFDGKSSHLDYNQKREIIEESIRNKEKIKITYQKSGNFAENEITQRIIMPQKIGYGDEFLNSQYQLNPQQIYIQGFCELRQENRTFLLDRIISIEKINKN